MSSVFVTHVLPPNSTLPSFPRLSLDDERHATLLLLVVVKAAVPVMIDSAVVSRKDLMMSMKLVEGRKY